MEELAGALPFLVLLLVMYFVLFLPQQRRTKRHREMLAALQEGDEVLTSSGIYGFVNAIDKDTLWIEVAEGTELKMARSSISSVVEVEPADG